MSSTDNVKSLLSRIRNGELEHLDFLDIEIEKIAQDGTELELDEAVNLVHGLFIEAIDNQEAA